MWLIVSPRACIRPIDNNHFSQVVSIKDSFRCYLKIWYKFRNIHCDDIELFLFIFEALLLEIRNINYNVLSYWKHGALLCVSLRSKRRDGPTRLRGSRSLVGAPLHGRWQPDPACRAHEPHSQRPSRTSANSRWSLKGRRGHQTGLQSPSTAAVLPATTHTHSHGQSCRCPLSNTEVTYTLANHQT